MLSYISKIVVNSDQKMLKPGIFNEIAMWFARSPSAPINILTLNNFFQFLYMHIPEKGINFTCQNLIKIWEKLTKWTSMLKIWNVNHGINFELFLFTSCPELSRTLKVTQSLTTSDFNYWLILENSFVFIDAFGANMREIENH